MSPAGSSQAEEQQYLDKLKQLSKYIEPLRRMINKIDKNEDRKKDLSKMKSLLDILTDPSKRCPLKTLQKCEIALEKLRNDMAVVSALLCLHCPWGRGHPCWSGDREPEPVVRGGGGRAQCCG